MVFYFLKTIIYFSCGGLASHLRWKTGTIIRMTVPQPPTQIPSYPHHAHTHPREPSAFYLPSHQPITPILQNNPSILRPQVSRSRVLLLLSSSKHFHWKHYESITTSTSLSLRLSYPVPQTLLYATNDHSVLAKSKGTCFPWASQQRLVFLQSGHHDFWLPQCLFPRLGLSGHSTLCSLLLFYIVTLFGDITPIHSLTHFLFPDDPKLQSQALAFSMITWVFVIPTLMLRRNPVNLFTSNKTTQKPCYPWNIWLA